MGKRILHPREAMYLTPEAQGMLYEIIELGVINEKEVEEILDAIFFGKKKEVDDESLKKLLIQKFSDRKLVLEKYFSDKTVQ